MRVSGIGRRWKAMMFALCGAILLAGLAGIWRFSWLQRVDLSASRELQSFREPSLDLIMQGATWLGTGYALHFVAIVTAALFFKHGRRREALAALLSLLSLPINIALKSIANRPRPNDPVAVITETYGSSFPSGHAMGSMAVYGTIAALIWTYSDRKSAVATFLLIPLLVGFSRVYLGAHWGYDVLAGWAAGALCVTAIIAWLRASTRVATGSPETATSELPSERLD